MAQTFDGINIGSRDKHVSVQSDISGRLVVGGDVALPATYRILGGRGVNSVNQRFTLAEVKAGATVVAAIPGYKIRMVDCTLCAIGGAAGAADGVKVFGTQAGSSVDLVTATTAVLTQNTLKRVGDTNVSPLAAGASFQACDANTAVTVGDYGAIPLDTLTHLDVTFTYALEPA